ncbi:hypothetical protein RQM47_09610 [Rubrivirga sp. S365]|uniref:hypothetical protein n=1 Tax=Rubrivirga sp. S365 TaxID=3076080 RepID=UPI0028C8E4DE|nr:hypothetical protein [Rubrivirga sp. S365]MDT7856895.1 hypothetical protein [Rubrivirga sp. S365]
MTPPRPALALVLVLALAGCASSGGAAGDRGLRSDQVRLGTPISSSSTVGTRDFVLRAFADCSAEPCHAESYRVVFSNIGQNALNSTFPGVTFEVDGVPYRFSTGETGVDILPNTYGEFLTIGMPRALFEDIAAAEAVRVVLGQQEFLLTPGDRRTLTDLVSRTTTSS